MARTARPAARVTKISGASPSLDARGGRLVVQFSDHKGNVSIQTIADSFGMSRPQLAETMNRLRNHGASLSEEQRHVGPRPYSLPDFNLLGFNYRMTDLQGAVGLVQLSKLDRYINPFVILNIRIFH